MWVNVLTTTIKLIPKAIGHDLIHEIIFVTSISCLRISPDIIHEKSLSWSQHMPVLLISKEEKKIVSLLMKKATFFTSLNAKRDGLSHAMRNCQHIEQSHERKIK